MPTLLTFEQLRTQTERTGLLNSVNPIITEFDKYQTDQSENNRDALIQRLIDLLAYTRGHIDDFHSRHISEAMIEEKLNLLQHITAGPAGNQADQLKKFEAAKIIVSDLLQSHFTHKHLAHQAITLADKTTLLKLSVNEDAGILPTASFQNHATQYEALIQGIAANDPENLDQLNTLYESLKKPIDVLFKPFMGKETKDLYVKKILDFQKVVLIGSQAQRPAAPNLDNLFERDNQHWAWLHTNTKRLRDLLQSNIEAAISLDDAAILNSPLNNHLHLFETLLFPQQPDEALTKADQVARLAHFMSGYKPDWKNYNDANGLADIEDIELDRIAHSLENDYNQLWTEIYTAPKPEAIIQEISKTETELKALQQRYKHPSLLDAASREARQEQIKEKVQRLSQLQMQATTALLAARQSGKKKIVKLLSKSLQSASKSNTICNNILPPKGKPLPASVYAFPKSGVVVAGENPFNTCTPADLEKLQNKEYTFSAPGIRGYENPTKITFIKLLTILPRLPGTPPGAPALPPLTAAYAAYSLLIKKEKVATVTFKQVTTKDKATAQLLTISGANGKKAQLNIAPKAAQTLIRNANPTTIYLADFSQKQEKQTRKIAHETAAVYIVENGLMQTEKKLDHIKSGTRVHKSDRHQQLINELNVHIKSSNGYDFEFSSNIHTILSLAEKYQKQTEKENRQLAAMPEPQNEAACHEAGDNHGRDSASTARLRG